MIKKNLRILFLLLLLVMSANFNSDIKITTESEKKFIANEQKVTDRELAMLASLVYEDVPNDENYSNSKHSDGCKIENGNITKTCHFTFYNNDYVTRNGKKVLQYVEGLSNRKKNMFTVLTTAKVEDGQKYYFYNFADTNKEAYNWEIVNYKSEISSNGKKASIGWEGQFDAITFKKGNNYVIAFRGTDYPDLLEWLQDISYATKKDHVQAEKAYSYAKDEYSRIVNENKNAKIYITGHSLGAYLAQIGAAAIIDIDKDGNNYNPKSSSNLEKVVYFNGMGISGLGLKSERTIDFRNALIYLGSHDKNGNELNSDTKVNYSDTLSSSGRLILYSMKGDPVSGVGVHYGEIRKLEPAADAVSNHKGNHIVTKGMSSASAQIISNLNKQNKNFLPRNYNENIKDNNITSTSDVTNKKFKSKLSSALKQFKSKLNNMNKVVSSYNTNMQELVEPRVSNAQASDDFDSGSYILLDATNFTSGISSMAKEYNVGSIIETANISHETDSFLCLIDDENGVPSLTGSATNATYDNKNQAITNVYANGKRDIILTANVTGGCARSYVWYKTDKDGNIIEKIATDSNNFNNYIALKSNSNIKNGDSEYYKVVVAYGNSYREQKLRKENGKLGYVLSDNVKTFEDEENTLNGKEKILTKMYKINYDTISPVCSFSTTSLTIKKGEQKIISFSCSDDFSDIKVRADKFELLDKYYLNHSESCSGNICDIVITAKKKLFNVTRYLSYKAKVKDKAGNITTVTDSLKIKTK